MALISRSLGTGVISAHFLWVGSTYSSVAVVLSVIGQGSSHRCFVGSSQLEGIFT